MNLYRFFKNSYTITFITQIVSIFFILIYLIFLAIFANLNLLSPQMEILLLLIALGASCLATLIGIGLFMRMRDKFMNILGSEEDFPSQTVSEKVVLIIWIAAILFFGAATYYSLFLLFETMVFPRYFYTFTLLIIFLFIGLIVICLILQLFIVIMAKFTRKVVVEVLKQPKK